MSRRALKCALFVMFVLALCCTTVQAKQLEIGQIQGKDVNMRATPSTDSPIVTKLAVGEQIDILSEQDGWYWVNYNGMTGYVHNEFVFVRSISDHIAYALQDGVRIYGGPGTSAYVVGNLKAGSFVRVQQMVGEWYFVTYEGITGFVNREYLHITSKTGVGAEVLLKIGMEGSEVKRLQKELVRRNFLLNSYVTGLYGSKTRDAVKEFQKAAGLGADGVAGAETIAAVFDPTNKVRYVDKTKMSKSTLKGKVQLIDWRKGGSSLIKRPGGTAEVYDVATGKTFNIRRTGGNKHNDVVPRTAADTAIFKSIVGHWSWNRRSIVIKVNGRYYAASMNGFPHAPDPQGGDNFPGHFCIHFLNSRTHGTNNLDPEHQAKIKYAYNKFK